MFTDTTNPKLDDAETAHNALRDKAEQDAASTADFIRNYVYQSLLGTFHAGVTAGMTLQKAIEEAHK